MDIRDLIKDTRIPWVIIKEISEYNHGSIHKFVKEDLIFYNLIQVIKNLLKVEYYGGHETIIKARLIQLMIEKLNSKHPDFIYRTPEFGKKVSKILKTFRSVVHQYLLATPITIVESNSFNFFWNYISDVYDIIYEGLKQR